MDTPNWKHPSSCRLNAEEEMTSGFLFDDSFDTSSDGIFLEEEQLMVTVTQFQPTKVQEMGGDSVMSCESVPESLTRSACNAATATSHPTATVFLIEQQQFLQSIFDGVSTRFPDLSFTMARDGKSSAPVLTVTQKDLFCHPPFVLISRVRLTIEYKKYSVFVLLHLWGTGEVDGIDDAHEICRDISSKSSYKFCPGIDPDYYEQEYHKVLRFDVKSARIRRFPFTRVDSANCKLWFKPALNLSEAQKAASELKCPLASVWCMI